MARAGYPNGKGFHVTFALVAGFPEWLQGAQMLRPQVSKLLATAASTIDQAKRKPLYWEFQKIWNQNLWGLEHGKRDTLSASTKRVGSFIENPSRYRNFRYTYIGK
jgi:ABC-type transport system substrate-binding protein